MQKNMVSIVVVSALAMLSGCGTGVDSELSSIGIGKNGTAHAEASKTATPAPVVSVDVVLQTQQLPELESSVVDAPNGVYGYAVECSDVVILCRLETQTCSHGYVMRVDFAGPLLMGPTGGMLTTLWAEWAYVSE